MNYRILFLVLCLLSSLFGAWTDIHYGCVRNRHLIGSVIAAIIITVVMTANKSLSWESWSVWVINLGLSIVLSVVFYLTDIWAPGDSKLFILIAALFPMEYYALPDKNIFPALSFVVYAYACGFVFLVVEALLSRKPGIVQPFEIELNIAFLRSAAVNLGIIVGFQNLIMVLSPEFSEANTALILLSSIGCCHVIHSRWKHFATVIGSIGLVFSLLYIFLSNSWRQASITLPLSVIIALFTQYLLATANRNSYKEIRGEHVHAGIILSYGSVMAMQNCIDPDIPRRTTENRRSRITSKQAEAVQKWCKNTGHGVVIVEMLPFAPFFFVAVLIVLVRWRLMM